MLLELNVKNISSKRASPNNFGEQMKKDPVKRLIEYQELIYKCKYIDGMFVFKEESNGKKKTSSKFYSK